MKFFFSRRVQTAALVSVLSACILVFLQVFRSLAEVFVISGPKGAALAAFLACAAGLFAWVGNGQFSGEGFSDNKEIAKG
jgi:ABC-type cobalamin transport system ATPase subunit